MFPTTKPNLQPILNHIGRKKSEFWSLPLITTDKAFPLGLSFSLQTVPQLDKSGESLPTPFILVILCF